MKHEHGSGSSKHSRMHPEAPSNIDGESLKQAKMSGFSSSSSSFDPLRLSNGDKDALDNSLSKSEQESFRSPPPEYSESTDVSAQTPEWSMISASPRAGAGHLSSQASSQASEWNTINSPPIEVMEKHTDYDPDRIPSSIFISKPASAMEWSAASNESLFSIHMGNNSFSRDHAILWGKSGELTKLENNFQSNLHSVIESPDKKNRIRANIGMDHGGKQDGNKTSNVVSGEAVENHNKGKMPPAKGVNFSATTSNVSNGNPMSSAERTRISASLSNESANSASSFAFPILAGDVVKNRLGKVVHEKSQSLPQTPEAKTPKAAVTRWLSRFSCCPLCS